MKKQMCRLLSLILMLCMLLSLCPSVYAAPSATQIVTTASGYDSAADVVYNTSGGYLANWGARGEDCGFLTTYAQDFYTGSYVYSTLSKVSGGTSTSNAPSSALYSSLQTLMTDNHTTFTRYGTSSTNNCKELYQYTDCMLGDPTYVSTLYRGETVGGVWDSGVSYNQEHIWPQSKCIGSSSTDIGDIMHLRPANSSENSSRGNTAYGESSDYYDPGVSVRGDCARTLLYMYVRWGNTSYMWGTDGVMESLDVLLRWIQEDPVDTWEMGHNDAVQYITGTRNVFVDYPEYAWLLFGQSVPADLTTPSTGGSGSSGGTATTSGTATLVTDASSLKAGDQILIAALDYDYALGTTQNTNNRASAAVTKSGSSLSYSADTQVITLEAGTVSSTFAFQAGSGQYLYAASSSGNYLKTEDAVSDNGSWSISIDSATGAAAVTANGTYTRNTLRYNSTSDLFSCYSASNSQKDIAIYKIGSSGEGSGSDTPSTEPSGSCALVTSVSELSAGDQIIIAALDYDYALGTTQNTSNRSQAAITKSGSIISYGSDVQIITLVAGTVSGTFAFQVGTDQYLYAPSSSSNHLKTTDSITDNGSWAITIDAATGAAAIAASGTSTRNVMRYNTSSGLFSCYSASNTQKDICIYKIGSSGTPESNPDYYLFGYINGADYACEGDYANMGQYKFVNGKLTVTFDSDSYIGVKTTDNAAWYMTQSYVTDTSATFYNTSTGAAEKMLIPGGVEVTMTLTVNADDTLSLQYVTAACAHSYTSKVTTAATCTAAGVKTYTCSKCGDSYTEAIAATGHSYTSKVTAPTCTAQGYTTYTCSTCGSSYTGNTTAATGHSYSSKVTTAATCTTNGVRTYTCSKCSGTYTEAIAATGHSYTSKVTAPTCTAQGYTTYTCSTCGSSYKDLYTAATGHSYTSKVTAPTCTASGYTTYTCSKCGSSYTGNTTAATGHNYVNGTCTGCGTSCVHSYTSKVTTAATCTTAGVRTYTCSKCSDSYTEAISATGHSYSSKVTAPTCTAQGYTTYTCSTCGSSYKDLYTAATGHTYVNGTCTTCGSGCTHSYTSTVTTAATCTTAGVRTYSCSKCSYSYTEAIAAIGHSYTSKVTAPTCTVEGYTTYTCSTCGSSYKSLYTAATGHTYVNGTCTTCGSGCAHSYTSTVTTAATCTTAGVRTYSCSKCSYSYTEAISATGHSFAGGSCTSCGEADPDYVDPNTNYYLFGYINGADYACEGDYENMGSYKFENGQLTATFTQNSYVGVKTEGNTAWYMTEGWQGTDATSVTLYNTNNLFAADKLFVPGNVEVTFTLTDNGDGSLTLSYTTAASTVPTLTLKYPTLTFEDVITMNVFFSAENLQDVVEMGLITYKSEVSEWNVNNAEAVVPGYSWNETEGFYVVSTEGIAAKDMGDTYWFAVYAKLADGTYTYTRLVSYSPTTYAYNQLSDASMSKLVVAMLNYGAAAQTYFNYKTDSLMNANLTAAQKASIESYRADMMDSISTVTTAKSANFTKTSTGFSSRYPTISFEGAFSIDYFCQPSTTVSGNITMYYWNQADFDAVSVLSKTNATGAITMAKSGSVYTAAVEGIAAKDLDKGVYVAFVYTDGTNEYCSGILGYSIGMYCVSLASGTDAMAPFAAATAVYGYYAKQMFN